MEAIYKLDYYCHSLSAVVVVSDISSVHFCLCHFGACRYCHSATSLGGGCDSNTHMRYYVRANVETGHNNNNVFIVCALTAYIAVHVENCVMGKH